MPNTYVRLSCDEYRLLLIAGPYRRSLPPGVQKLMDAHKTSCDLLNGSNTHQSDFEIPVNSRMDLVAKELVEKLQKELDREEKITKLNDRAETLLTKISQCLSKSSDLPIEHIFEIYSLELALKTAREKAGRELPPDQ